MKFLNHNLFTGDITVNGTTTLSTATGITRATGDNSTHLATTAFVKAQGYATTAALAGYVPITRTITINGTTLDLSADRTWTIEVASTVRTVYETVKNVSGATILKGTPLAVVAGQTSGNVSDVVPANAADPTKMPAVFIANQDILNEAEGEAVLFGNLTGVDTSLYQSGTTVYVAPGGGWTATKPVWPNKIQNLGVITKQHATNGAGIVTGVGRANDLPNLTAGKIWVGSANYPIESTTVHVDEANGRVGIGLSTNLYGKLSISSGNFNGLRIDTNAGNDAINIGGTGRFTIDAPGITGGRFIVTNAGDVGIGTVSPNEKLHVAGNIHAYAAGGIDAGLFASTSAGATTIALRSNGVTHLNGGNVGIGTTAPAFRLDVNGTFQSGGDATFNGTNTYINSSYIYVGNNTSDLVSISGNTMYFPGNGNVGIGTTNPIYKLDIAGAVRLTGSLVFDDLTSNLIQHRAGTDVNTLVTVGHGGFDHNGYLRIGGADVATQAWVQSQGYLTSETDSQTLSWNAGSKNLTISNGNTVTLDGLATEDFVTSQGYITGYTETDTLASVTGRGATTSSKVFFTHNATTDPLSAVEINGGGTHTGLYINPAASAQAHVRFGTNGALKWQIRAPFQDGVDTALKFYSWVSGADKFQFEHSGNAIFNGGTVWTSANDGSGSGLDADLLDGIDSGSFIRSDVSDLFSGTLTMGSQRALIPSNYGHGVYGIYSAERYQHVWSMGAGYDLPADGASNGNGGSLYGLAWSYNPDYGYVGSNAQAKPGLNHQLLLMMNGVTHTALGSGIWTNGTITTVNHGTSSQWNTAYSWGNHASQGYATQTYVNTAISNLVDAAPTTLDTLNELAAALGDDPNFATTVATSIGTKLPLAGGTMTGQIITPSVSTGVYDGAIQIREQGYVTNTQTAWGYSPAITFHWGNIAGKRFGMRSDGQFAIDDAPLALQSWVTSQGYTTNTGTVTSVSGTGGYGGLTLSGTVTSSGNITLGGTPTGTWPISVSGNAATATSATSATSATQVVTLQDDPPAGVNGKLWWETDTGKLKVYYGASSAWVDALPMPDMTLYLSTAGGAISGDLSIAQTLTVTGNILSSAVITATGGNSTNWNTAYGWGNHASAGYLTSYTETDTLATVVSRGNSTSSAIRVKRPSNKVDNSGATEFGGRIEFNNDFVAGESGYMVFRYPTYNNFLIGGDYDGNIGGAIPNIQFGRSNGSVYMHIAAQSGTGNVGIGTTSPDSPLEVNGRISIRGANELYFGQSTSAIGSWTTRMYASGSTHKFNANEFIFNNEGYGSLEYMKLTASGFSLRGKNTIDSTDSWLRLNQAGEYASGVYTPYVLRNDGEFTNYGGIFGYNGIRGRKAQTDNNYTTAALWTESYDNTTTGIAFHISGNVGKFLEMRTDGVLYWENAKVWTAGNDGAGSGLDADLLDGQHGSYYQPASTAITTSNIGSQSVSYATSAGNSSTTSQRDFNYLSTRELQLGSFKTYNVGTFSAASTQARRFLVGKIGIDYNDWNGVGMFEVEIAEQYYFNGLRKRYIVNYGYGGVNSIQLVEYNGIGANNADVIVDGPVQISGDHYVLSVYVRVRYYGTYAALVKTTRSITSSNPPGIGQAAIFMDSGAENISDFTPDSIVYLTSGQTGIAAPIFYDSDDTNYYVNPNSSSRLSTMQIDRIGVGQAVDNGYRIITSGDIYLNAVGNGWAEGVWKQRRGGSTFYDVIDAGNIGSQSVSYATTAGALTSMNISQFTNDSGYITGYTETNTFLGDGGAGDTHPGTSRLIFTGQLSAGSDVLGMPATDNSNAFLNINRHPGEYNSQLGFSSNGSMYYRSFSANAINSTQAWRQVWDSGNLTNLNQLTNGPGYITGNQTITLSGDVSGSGTTSIVVTVNNIDGWGFVNTGSNDAVNADTIDSNGITYYTAGVSNFSGNATDGALYSQRYSDSWQHQIAGDYRSGMIAVRGKNNGTWTAWRTIIDSSTIGSQSVNYAASAGNADTLDTYHETAFVRLAANSSSPTNGAFAIGSASSRNFIQSHSGQPLDINPLGNAVTIGTDLTVDAYLTVGRAMTDPSRTRMFMPGGGSYVTTTSVVNGAIRIKLPTQGSGMMMTCTVKVYEYSVNKSFTITFGGHRDSNNWYNEFCYIDGDKSRGNLTVRFGVSGGKDCVWIGENDSSWSYPQVFVTDFQLGYVGYSPSWATGWEIAFTGSFDTINRTQTAYAKITSENIGSQSVSYATSAGSASSATTSSNVTVNSGNTSAAWYPIVWHSGNTLYSSSSTEIYANGNYIRSQYINTTDNDETGITRFVIKNTDNYHRSATTTTAADIIRGVASGSWGISITGNAATATSATSATSASTAGYADEAKWISFPDGPRDLSDRLPNWNNRSVAWDFVGAGTANGSGNYGGVMTFSPWDGTSASTGDSSYQLAFANATGVNASGQPKLSIRNGINSTWNAWYTLMHSGNIGDQSVNYATTAGTANAVAWTNVSGRPTAVSSFTNDSGYLTASGTIANATSATQVVTIQDDPPAGVNGKLWWESDTGKLKVYYGTSSAWVDATPVPDMSLYYAKAGGPISGDVTIQQTLTVVGNTLIQGTLTETSDISLKENILPLESSLDKVMKLNGVSFNKKATPNVKEIGFIAQEVEAVIPDLVTETNEGIKTVSYSRVTAVLVETIKEQQAQIEELKNMVNMLAEKLNNL
jgi:hypothetical protein